MATMKDIIQSPLLLALVIGGLLYISAFSLVYLKKAYDHQQQGGQRRHQGRAAGADHHDGALPRRTPCRLRLRAGRACGHLYHRDAAHRHPDLLAARLAGYGSVLGGLVGIFIIVMLPIGILTSYVLWKKGKIQVVDKEQKEK